jgi:hypothetical protein
VKLVHLSCDHLTPLQSFTLSITPDGKKVTGKIEGEELDFEV